MQVTPRNPCVTVTTWPFVVSLLVLLVNDTWLKQAFPGAVTGKLSDFAGIALLSLLLFTTLPQRRVLVYTFLAGGFAWWKSSLSQPAIEAINAYLAAPIGRTVDYTDLAALAIAPLCRAVALHPAGYQLPGLMLRRLLLAPLIVLTVGGLAATSMLPTRHDYQVRWPIDSGGPDHEAIARLIARVAALHDLQCEDCTNRLNGARYTGRGVYLTYSFSTAHAVSIQVEAASDGLFLGASGQEKADRLRRELKSRLASSYKNLEYVEQLDPAQGISR